MNKNLNIFQLNGRVITDPEIIETKSGKKLMTFNFMYFTKNSTDSEGSHVNFIKVEAWEKIAIVMTPLLIKGSDVIVNGELVQKRWFDADSKQRSQFVIVANSLTIMENQNENDDQ